MKKISSLMLASILGVATFAGVLVNKKAKAEPVKAEDLVFYIGTQDMTVNPVYEDGYGGTATFDTSSSPYVLTLDNFNYTGTGTTTDGASSSIYIRNLPTDLTINLKGASTIHHTEVTQSYLRALYAYTPTSNMVTLKIQTDPSYAGKASLNLITDDGTSSYVENYAYYTSNHCYTKVENCILSGTAGGGRKSFGFSTYGGINILDEAQITAQSGTASYYSCGFYATSEGFKMDGGSLTATAGASTSASSGSAVGSYGAAIWKLTQNGGTINLTGGTANAGNSAGMESWMEATFNGGTSTFVGGSSVSGGVYGVYQHYSSVDSYAFSVNNDVTKVLLQGDTQSINFPVKNKFDGYGWDNIAGSGAATLIPATDSGVIPTSKRLQFQPVKATSTNSSVNYDGSSHNALSVSVSQPTSGYTIYYKGPGDADYSTTVPSYINAGTYSIDWKVEATYYATKTGSISFTINKVDSSLTSTPALVSDFDFDNTSHAICSAGLVSGGTIYYSVGSTPSAWDTYVPTAKMAGNYTVWYKVVGDSNHNDIDPVCLGTVHINSLDFTDVDVHQTGTLTYTGTSQTATVSASATAQYGQSPITFKYSTSSIGPWSEDVPSFTTAGSHTAYYQILAPNHNETIGSFIITIGKADSTLVAPTGKTNLVYTGEEQNLLNSVGLATGGQIYYKVDDGAYSPAQPKATTAGNHTVYYKVVGDTNHNDYPESYLVVNIAKANPSYVAPTGKTELAYNGTSQALLETAGSCDYGTIQYRVGTLGWYSDAIPEVTAAGDYDVYYEIVSTNSNYNSLTDLGPIHVSIAKADPVFTAPVGKSSLFIYNGNPQELLQSAGSATGGTIYYKVNDGEYSTDLPTATNAGDYTIYYKVVGDSNHNDIAESSLSVHLREANLVAYGVSQEGTLTYNGSPQVATVSESVKVTGHQPTTFHYSTSEEGPWTDSVPAFTNAGDHTVYCYISAPNHFDTPVFSFTVTINKADSTLVAPTGKSNLVYTGEEQNLLNSIGSATGGQIYYKVDDGAYSPAQPKATTAGDHTVYYKVVGDANHNDYPEGSLVVNIAKADPTISVTPAAIENLHFSGAAQTLISAGTASGGTLQYKVGDGEYSTSLPKATNVGTYTIYYKVVGDSNHNDIAEESFTVSIAENDKTGLTNTKNTVNEYLSSIEERYPDIASDLQAVIDEANACLEDPNQTSEQIEAKIAALNNALSTAEVDVVIAKIDAIGEVTNSEACKEKIDEAQAAFDALTPEQQAEVTNSKTLEEDQNKYNELANKEDVEKPDNDNGKKLPTVVIVIIPVGSVLLLGAIVVLIIAILKKKKAK